MSLVDTLAPDSASQSEAAPDKRYQGLQRVLSSRDRELAQAKAEIERLREIAEEAAIYRDMYFSNESDSAPVEQPDPAQDEPEPRLDPNNPMRRPAPQPAQDPLTAFREAAAAGAWKPDLG